MFRPLWAGASQVGGIRTYLLSSGGVPLIEVDVNGVVTAVNTFGATGLLSRRTGGTGGPTTFYTFDPQGNVCQRLNAAAAVTSTDVYDAFGKGHRTPAGINDVYGFGGQWGYYHDWDTPLALHLLTHRYLDSNTGRFLTRDPIGYAGGGNLYRFVGNNPTGFADPSGLVERGQYVAGGAALGAGTGVALGGGVPGAAFLGVVFGHIGGSLYDSAEDFGLAWGCYEGGRAKLWQLLWSGAKATSNVVGTAATLRVLGAASAPPPPAPAVAPPAVETATAPNRIYSARVLHRAAEEPGSHHNFPMSFDDVIFTQGTRVHVDKNYYEYRLEGSIMSRGRYLADKEKKIVPRPARSIEGRYEIGVEVSPSGRTERITHRFFRRLGGG